MASLDRVTRAELAASGDLFDTGYEPRMGPCPCTKCATFYPLMVQPIVVGVSHF